MYTLKLRSISAYPAANASGEWYTAGRDAASEEEGEEDGRRRDSSTEREGAAAGRSDRRERKDIEKRATIERRRSARGKGDEAPARRPAIAGGGERSGARE